MYLLRGDSAVLFIWNPIQLRRKVESWDLNRIKCGF